MRLENRIALITGAGRGIGRAIAEHYAREGARVAVADLTLESAPEAVEAIENADGLAMDVTDEAVVDEGVATIVKTWGGLDIAVANAGIQHRDPIHKLAYADWRRVINVHLDGAFLVTRAALRSTQKYRGQVLHFTSALRFRCNRLILSRLS